VQFVIYMGYDDAFIVQIGITYCVDQHNDGFSNLLSEPWSLLKFKRNIVLFIIYEHFM
jgi:hypothetical protein